MAQGEHWTSGTTAPGIRPAEAGDAAALSELAERTFRDAFAAMNTAEDMDLHCARFFAPAIQAAEIADPGIVTLVADAQGALVAFAQLHVRGAPPAGVAMAPAAELRRIYVDASLHGSGLARRLLDRVVAAAVERGAKVLWLGVWERNPRAIRFYRRAGFAEVGEHVFTVGNDPQRDLVMARALAAPLPPAVVSLQRRSTALPMPPTPTSSAPPAIELRVLTGRDVAVARALNAMFGRAFGDEQTYTGSPPSDRDLERLLDHDTFVAIAALDGARVVGGLTGYVLRKLEQARSELYLYDLAVDADSRRRGIATALIDRLRQLAAERAVHVIIVQADLGDEPAIALYTKLGVREDVLHFDIAPLGTPTHGMGDPDSSRRKA